MPRKKISERFRQWILDLFSPKDEIRFTPNAPSHQSGSGTLFNNAEGFAIHNSQLTGIGNQYNTYVQGDHNIVPHIMSILSQHAIPGAAHDSSARTPPPRCHPGTRIKLIGRITAWFEGQEILELLLWITGPAGVGKSALVQTFAEYLVKSKSLGASVFISRPNKRNNPHGVFLTIAYQLATRIELYCNFIAERLCRDPELLSKDMQTQFATFIIEPFVERKIGAGGKRWCILLDGLDELQGEDAQRNVIRLISNFVLEHRDTPLVWIIASRPELHISNTFEDDEARSSHRKEYIPIDSTEACEDVECFLRSKFKTLRKEYRNSVPRDWPSDSDFLKLTAAASGLFIYAQVVSQFIGDPGYADPISRFDVLISVIDRSNAVPTKENPFVHLDALYNEILSSIPSTMWPAAKRLLAFTVHSGHEFLESASQYPNNLRARSILLHVPRHVIYACLNKCRSVLKLPDWKVAHKETLAFHHASFADYLGDSSRSEEFYVGDQKAVKRDVQLSALEVWNECSGDNTAPASVQVNWDQYCLKWDVTTPSKAVARCHGQLFRDIPVCIADVFFEIFIVPEESSEPPGQPLFSAQWHRINMANLFYWCQPLPLVNYILGIIWTHSQRLNDASLVQPTELRHLKLGHLNCNEMTPSCIQYEKSSKLSKEKHWISHQPRSGPALEVFVSELESIQESSPELEVLILGGAAKGKVAIIRHPSEFKDPYYELHNWIYYVIPYPDS